MKELEKNIENAIREYAEMLLQIEVRESVEAFRNSDDGVVPDRIMALSAGERDKYATEAIERTVWEVMHQLDVSGANLYATARES